MTYARTFGAEVASVPAARHFVRAALRDEPAEIIDAVELMVCELATNCVKHAHSGFELAIDDASQEIRVEVSDTGGGRPMLRSGGPSEPSGRGLRIVEAMAAAWGVKESPEGKTVWFTMPAVHAPWAR